MSTRRRPLLSFRATPFAIWTLSLVACGGASPRTTAPDDWGMTADLRVDAPEGCPGKDVLAQAVSERVGRVAFVARPDAEVLVDVSIQPAPGGFGVQVTTRDPEGAVLGSRTLQEQATDCETIRDAVAFVVALVVSAPSVREAVETAREQTVVELGVRGGGRVGRTPHWSGVVGLYTTVVPPRFVPVRFDLTASLPGREDIDGGRELEAWGGELMVSLCPRVSAGVFRFDICGGAAVGFVRGVGTGFDEGASTLATTVDVALHARPGVRLGRFLLTLDLGVGLALLRPTFVAEDSMGAENGVYEPSLLWGEAQLGLGVAFD